MGNQVGNQGRWETRDSHPFGDGPKGIGPLPQFRPASGRLLRSSGRRLQVEAYDVAPPIRLPALLIVRSASPPLFRLTL